MEKVICFNASPNENGNTGYSLSRIGSRLEGNGVFVKYVNIKNKKINSCSGCLECRKQKLCAQDDYFTAIQEELLEADAILIGTPVYFDYPTAEFFALLGRFSSIMGKQHIKKAGFVFTFGNSRVENINSISDNCSALFQKWFQIPETKAILLNRLSSSKITDHPEYLESIDGLASWIMR